MKVNQRKEMKNKLIEKNSHQRTILHFCLQPGLSIPTDMHIEILRAKEYWEWKNNGTKEEWLKTEIVVGEEQGRDIIPVGTVEWTREYCLDNLLHSDPDIHYPILIPTDILGPEFLGREVRLFDAGSLPEGEWMVKHIEIVKNRYNGWYRGGRDSITFSDHHRSTPQWQISKRLEEDIESEFRVFIGRRGEILDVRPYIGWEPWPDKKKLCDMAKLLHSKLNRPFSFDVVVTSQGNTYFLEAHDYWGLGLYGFSRPDLFPFLLRDWWFQGRRS